VLRIAKKSPFPASVCFGTPPLGPGTSPDNNPIVEVVGLIIFVSRRSPSARTAKQIRFDRVDAIASPDRIEKLEKLPIAQKIGRPASSGATPRQMRATELP
jgi:hypothetical protein